MQVLVPNNTPVYTIFQVTNVNCMVCLIPAQHTLLAYQTISISFRLLKVVLYLILFIPYSPSSTWYVVLSHRRLNQVGVLFSTPARQSRTSGS